MSTKRQPSKQRRQTQNQRQRAALETRRANAAAEAPPAKASSGKASGGGSTKSSSSSRGSVLTRLRGASATGRAIRTRAPVGSQPPGYRAALSGLLAAVAAAVVGAVLIPVQIDAHGEPIASSGALIGEWSISATDALAHAPGATSEELVKAVDDWSPNGSDPYGLANFPLSLALVLPAVGAGLAFRAVSKRSSAKVVNRAMYVTLFGTLLNAQLLFLFLPAIVGIGIAAFQVRKAEVAAAAEDADDEPMDDDEVIDVEPVDDDVVDDEAEYEDEVLDEAVDDDVEPVDVEPQTVLGRLRRPPQRNV
jgi:hypothetical protein